jgi:hypothetical protein
MNKNKFKCIDEGYFNIYGNYNSEKASQLYLSVDRCVNTTENGNMCAPAQEIDEFLTDKYILLLYNQVHFNLTAYH